MEKYIVKLTQEERLDLLSLIRKGKASAPRLTHARILLEADEGPYTKNKKTDFEIAEQLHVGLKTVKRRRKQFVEEGLEAALSRKAYLKTKENKLSGEEEAHLIAICCSSPPEGRNRWTLKLLSTRLVEMEIVDSISPATVGRALKKTNLNLGKNENGVSHPKQMQNLFVKWKTF